MSLLIKTNLSSRGYARLHTIAVHTPAPRRVPVTPPPAKAWYANPNDAIVWEYLAKYHTGRMQAFYKEANEHRECAADRIEAARVGRIWAGDNPALVARKRKNTASVQQLNQVAGWHEAAAQRHYNLALQCQKAARKAACKADFYGSL